MSVQDTKTSSTSPTNGSSKQPLHETTYLLGAEDRGRGTFMHESTLPSLPLPALEDTLDLYLDSVRPHLTTEEYQVTEGKVTEFKRGVGPKLHTLLQRRQQEKRNWLEDWWLHNAYLTYREPILPNLNTSGLNPLNTTIWEPCLEKGFEYGALFIWSTLHFYKMLREERYKPHTTRDGKPLSMEQFRWVFNCTRLPGYKVDSLYSTWKTKSEGDCPLHIAVLCKGHVWILYPWTSGGTPLSPPALEEQIKHVWDMSTKGEGACIAALTCDRREQWAENREWLKSLSLANMRNLDLVESASFVVVLDESCPANMNEFAWQALCGNAENRWADKSTSALIMRNGYIANNNDHTPYDAMVSVTMAHYQQLLLEHVHEKGESVWKEEEEEENGDSLGHSLNKHPQHLHFDVDDKLKEAIEDAKRLNGACTRRINALSFFFTEYGRDFLRPHHLHPDSYVQMALQLTYYRLHGRPAPTYETASTRQFYHGRTETIRSCTPEAMAWARAMGNPGTSISERRRKLVAAIEKHNEIRERCERGMGIDRHLMGLYLTAVEEGVEVPEIFTDQAFYRSGGGGNFALSTSTTGYTSAFGGVAAMTEDGYGCFYSINNNRFIFFVSNFTSSTESDAEKFLASLTHSLCDMKQLFTTALKSSL